MRDMQKNVSKMQGKNAKYMQKCNKTAQRPKEKCTTRNRNAHNRRKTETEILLACIEVQRNAHLKNAKKCTVHFPRLPLGATPNPLPTPGQGTAYRAARPQQSGRDSRAAAGPDNTHNPTHHNTTHNKSQHTTTPHNAQPAQHNTQHSTTHNTTDNTPTHNLAETGGGRATFLEAHRQSPAGPPESCLLASAAQRPGRAGGGGERGGGGAGSVTWPSGPGGC